VAIERNVDVKGLIGIKGGVWQQQLLRPCEPILTGPRCMPAEDPDREPTVVENLLLGKGSHLALAIFCSKAFVPIKLPLAAALTPYVHR
jgi:hypothetical protein